MKTPLSLLVFSLVISCTNSRNNDCYEIYNAVLREKFQLMEFYINTFLIEIIHLKKK